MKMAVCAGVLAVGVLMPGALRAQDAPPGPQESDPLANLVVRFEGGEVSDNIARVFQKLHGVWADFPVKSYRLVEGDNICKVFETVAGFPTACSRETQRLANKINHEDVSDAVQPRGKTVLIPNVTFSPYRFALQYNPKSESRLNTAIENRIRNWSDLKTADEQGDSFKRATFTGYRVIFAGLRLGVAARLRTLINALESANIRATVALDRSTMAPSGVAKPLFVVRDPNTYETRCATDKGVGPGDQGAYQYLINRHPQAGELTYRMACLGPARCASLVLIDTPVESHVALTGPLSRIGIDTNNEISIVQYPTISGFDPKSTTYHCERAKVFNEQISHGTYMAGVTSSQDNGKFGFIGLSPTTPLLSFDWVKGTVDDLVTLNDGIVGSGAFNEDNGYPIFLFASKFPVDGTENQAASETAPSYGVKQLTEGGTRLLENDGDGRERRLTGNFLARRIVEAQPLWIVAAGQFDDVKHPPLDLDAKTPYAPMNLGDKENVIVVTACDQCDNAKSTLLARANYSTHGLVAVAAPGRQIISTVGTSSYHTSDGTSAASAFVAGVVASMLNRYPQYYYRAPSLIKQWLEITAFPIIGGADAGRVVTGVVDPTLATLNPRQTWVLQDSAALTQPRTAASLGAWCRSTLVARNPDDRRKITPALNTDTIRRIVRVADEPNMPKEWVLYTQDGPSRPIQKIGPVLLDGGSQPLASLGVGGDGGATAVQLDQIRDLITPLNRKVKAC